MAGKLCDGVSTNIQKTPRNSKAYAEGRIAAIAGAADTTNPHAAGTPENVAWAAGHASDAADPAGWPRGRDCVAESPGGSYTP